VIERRWIDITLSRILSRRWRILYVDSAVRHPEKIPSAWKFISDYRALGEPWVISGWLVHAKFRTSYISSRINSTDARRCKYLIICMSTDLWMQRILYRSVSKKWSIFILKMHMTFSLVNWKYIARSHSCLRIDKLFIVFCDICDIRHF